MELANLNIRPEYHGISVQIFSHKNINIAKKM